MEKKILNLFKKYQNWEEKFDRGYFNDKCITLVTHAGNFHSDDIMSTAILEYLFNFIDVPTRVIRTNKPKEAGYTDETENCIVYDIGLGQYDHHQIGEAAAHCIRKDEDQDRKYAAVGLIWKEVGELIVGKYADQLYNEIIKYIDDHDNGFGPNPLSMLIKYNNPASIDASMEIFDFRFESVVKHVRCMMDRVFSHYQLILGYESIVRKIAVENAPYLVTESFYPGATDVCRELNIPFYIYPSQRGGWAFQTINKSIGTQSEHLMDIPDEVRTWEGVTFLHASRFLGSAVTKERAIEVIEQIHAMNEK